LVEQLIRRRILLICGQQHHRTKHFLAKEPSAIDKEPSAIDREPSAFYKAPN